MIKYWGGQGHSVTCVTLDDGEQDFFELPANIRRLMLDTIHPSSNPMIAILSNIARIQMLKTVLNTLNPEIIVIFIAPTNILSILTACYTRAKVIISERNVILAKVLVMFRICRLF